MQFSIKKEIICYYEFERKKNEAFPGGTGVFCKKSDYF